MRVAFDYKIFSSQVYGGVSRCISSLAYHLASQGYADVRIFAPLYINSYLSKLPEKLVYGRKIGEIRYTKKIVHTINRYVSAPKIRGFHPDIVHESYCSRFSYIPENSRHIITIHDMIHEHFPKMSKLNSGFVQAKKIAIQRADMIICVSESTRRDLLEYYDLPEENVSVVYHGIDVLNSEYSPAVQDISPEQKPYLLYVGQRRGYKNFEAFIRAYAGSPWLHENFMIVCFGGNTFDNSEYALFQKLDLSDLQLKQVDGKDALLAQYYRHAEVLVYPSIYEGFGIPPLEAMSNNCPVICSDTSSIPEVTGNAAAYFDPTSISSMQHVMETVLQSPDKLSNLRNRGLERANLFSWDKCASDTLNIYKKALGK